MIAKKTTLSASCVALRQEGTHGAISALAGGMRQSLAPKHSPRHLLPHIVTPPPDPFYTPHHLITSELAFYQEEFAGMRVLCNCNDPTESQFFQHFAFNFERLKLRQLVSTTFHSENRDMFREYQDDHGLHLQFNGNPRGEGAWKPDDVQPRLLWGGGDFRSDKCVGILKECDVVVTHPPFWLVSQFIPMMMAHGKKILIIVPYTCVYKKEIFPFIKEEKLWTGHGDCRMKFHTPASMAAGGEPDKEVRAVWLTNLGQPREIEPLHLVCTYNERVYPRYDDYDAIEVGKFSDVPRDYDGLMGVPFTCLHRLDRRQFELVDAIRGVTVRGKSKFARVIIRRK